MKVSVIIRQINKSGNKSFEAVANVNIGSAPLSDVSKEIAAFSKGIVALQEKNAKRGYPTAVNAIKKSLPVELSLVAEGETLTMTYRNYGKFCREATEANLRGFLKDNIEFTEKFANFNREEVVRKVA